MSKTIKISAKHCHNYHLFTDWPPNTANSLHPNYIQTLSLPMQLEMMLRSPFPFKVLGLIHLANEIKVETLPKASTVLTLSTLFGKVYYHRKGWLFEVITTARESHLETTVNSVYATSYYLARCEHSEEQILQCQKALTPAPTWIAALSHTENLNTLPQEIDEQALKFDADIGRRYAKISGDYNPIHLYPVTAKLLGFKKAIAHGMFSKAWAVSKLAESSSFPEQQFLLRTVFSQAIFLPSHTQLVSKVSDNRGIQFQLNSGDSKLPSMHLKGCIMPLKHARKSSEIQPADIEIIPFEPQYAHYFETINKQWIDEMFVLEDIDKSVLENPQPNIIEPGGEIWFARHPALGIVGTCALLKKGDGVYELTKMGVFASARGLKVGETLLQYVIDYAKRMELDTLFLLTNTQCEAAIHLYEKNGFIRDHDIMENYGKLYQRCDVAMHYPL